MKNFICLVTGYKNLFDQKELQIKISSLLNVSNGSSSKIEEFILKNIEVFVDSKKQNWFKRGHIGKFLGIHDIWTSLNGLQKCEMFTRQELVPGGRVTSGFSAPKDQQNKTDKFLSVFGVMYAIVNSGKDKGKAVKEHILRETVPFGFDVEGMQEQHRHAVTDRDN